MSTSGASTSAGSIFNSDGSINYNSLLSTLGSVGSSVAGGVTANNAAAAQVTGTGNAIGATTAGGQAVQGIYSGQQALGNNAFTQLGSALGLPGSTPLSPNFLSQIPGLTQATNQGVTAAQNMISAGGNLYNSGTPAQVGNYISSQIALPAYQNYVSNLLSTAGIGNQANTGLAASQLTTSGNVAQELQYMGQENASGVGGVGGAINNGINSLTGAGTSGGSGSSSPTSALAGLLQSLFGGGSSFTPNVNAGGGINAPTNLGQLDPSMTTVQPIDTGTSPDLSGIGGITGSGDLATIGPIDFGSSDDLGF